MTTGSSLTAESWRRLATAVAEAIPPVELDGLWRFRPLRVEKDEWGTVILSRVDGDRRRIYTARYVHTIKGRERGKFSCEILEVGSGPVAALDELVAAVPKRSEEEPPDPVPLETWFPPEPPDGAATED